MQLSLILKWIKKAEISMKVFLEEKMLETCNLGTNTIGILRRQLMTLELLIFEIFGQNDYCG